MTPWHLSTTHSTRSSILGRLPWGLPIYELRFLLAIACSGVKKKQQSRTIGPSSIGASLCWAVSSICHSNFCCFCVSYMFLPLYWRGAWAIGVPFIVYRWSNMNLPVLADPAGQLIARIYRARDHYMKLRITYYNRNDSRVWRLIQFPGKEEWESRGNKQ